jgi:hypothetical protein
VSGPQEGQRGNDAVVVAAGHSKVELGVHSASWTAKLRGLEDGRSFMPARVVVDQTVLDAAGSADGVPGKVNVQEGE